MVGGNNEQKNISVANKFCSARDKVTLPVEIPQLREQGLKSYGELIRYVTDRPGRDRWYAIDSARIKRELGWQVEVGFKAGLRSAIEEQQGMMLSYPEEIAYRKGNIAKEQLLVIAQGLKGTTYDAYLMTLADEDSL